MAVTKVTPIPTVRKDVRDGEMERDGVKQNDGIEIHEHAEPSRRFTMSLEKHVAQGAAAASPVAVAFLRNDLKCSYIRASLDNLAMFFGTPI